MKGLTLAGCLSAVLGVLATTAIANADTLDTVKQRGKLICGVSLATPGFAAPNDQGRMEGFDADICRAIAAAALGDGDKVEYVPTNINTRFQALQSGEIDVLSRHAPPRATTSLAPASAIKAAFEAMSTLIVYNILLSQRLWLRSTGLQAARFTAVRTSPIKKQAMRCQRK